MSIGFIFWCIMLLVILGKLAVWRGIGGPYILTIAEWVINVPAWLARFWLHHSGIDNDP